MQKFGKFVRILLLDDDKDDFVLIRDLLSDINPPRYRIKWIPDDHQALRMMQEKRFDVCLVDYLLGHKNGLEFLNNAKKSGVQMPIIFLTGKGNDHLDMEALNAGAADYLDKNGLTPALLDRSIRYSIERSRIQNSLLELSSKLFYAHEADRKYVAAELHDSISSRLAGIKYALEGRLSYIKGGHSPEGLLSLEDVVSMLQETMREIRMIILKLRPGILDDVGIIATARWLCQEFEKIYSDIKMEYRIEEEETHIPDHLKIVIYRILQEALSNVAKHSSANLVRVELFKNISHLILRIEDNGKGLKMNDPSSQPILSGGNGLSNMMDRARLSGGAISFSRSEWGGTTICCTWPL